MPEEKDRSKRSSCLKIGAYTVIKKIIEDYKLDEMMKRIIGRDSGLFLDLAAYSIVTENNAGQYYPDYGYNHPLFTDKMRIYSDSKVSDFITSITSDQSIEFLNEWNASRDHREKIYISYDSTNKACQAGDVGIAEFGHPKDGKEYDEAVKALKELREKEKKENQEALLKAVAESKWSYEKIMEFIESNPEDIEE